MTAQPPPPNRANLVEIERCLGYWAVVADDVDTAVVVYAVEGPAVSGPVGRGRAAPEWFEEAPLGAVHAARPVVGGVAVVGRCE